MPSSIRFHFVADTHLGFDLPERPRVPRRRRGHDFFANFERVLDETVQAQVDFLVHGGDLFHRSRVRPSVVQRAFLGLKRVAAAGIPVVLVPGNHERSRIPYPLLAEHPGIHIFRVPSTTYREVRGTRIGLAGFPYQRRDVRTAFPDLVRSTDWVNGAADLNLLCVHHCFEGATVGPGNFTFRYAADVVRHHDVPVGFAAVLSGHIHRHQILTQDLNGRSVAVPVVYPGSVERTAFAEIDEPKGYLAGEITDASTVDWEFRVLPARPMVIAEIERRTWNRKELARCLADTIARQDSEAVLRIRVGGDVSTDASRAMSAERIRAMAPPTMNVEITLRDGPGGRLAERHERRRAGRRGAEGPGVPSGQLPLSLS